jgi:mannose-6-phosphate isomerase-like protein (cupin superfamily)
VGYSMVHVDDLPREGPGGVVRFVRRHLDVGAFGINWFEIPPDTAGHEHNEQETEQEEVNVIIAGSGVYRVEGEDIPVRRGSVMRFDPETTRVPIAGPEGMTMIAVGARRGSYEPRGPF